MNLKNLLGSTKDKINCFNQLGIYKITCGDCELCYIGQSKRKMLTRFKEHTACIKYNKPERSTVASHALDNNHFNITSDNLQLIKAVSFNKLLDAYIKVYLYKRMLKT